MRVDPRRLGVLRAVADAGGILAAAQVLHLTPSAVSQHIGRLEAETGVTLLDRSRLGGRRAVGLTTAGWLLADHAKRVAEALASAERELSELTGHLTGPVVVGAFPTAIRHLVVPAAATLADSGSGVTIQVRQIEPGPGLAALRAGALDVLVVESDAVQPRKRLAGLTRSWLLDDAYQVVVPAAWGAVAGIDALLTRPWVDGPAGSAVQQVLDRIAAHHDVTLHRVHECLEFPPALAIVAGGLAAAVVPTLALPPDDQATVVVVDGPVLGARRLDLIYRHGRHEPSPAARVVAQALKTRATVVGRAAAATGPARR
jgi:DNA-binding transcriptional LysR family regulator